MTRTIDDLVNEIEELRTRVAALERECKVHSDCARLFGCCFCDKRGCHDCMVQVCLQQDVQHASTSKPVLLRAAHATCYEDKCGE